MKRLLILVLLMHFTQIHFGQEVRFSGVVSKNKVAVGEQFRLTYSVNVSASGFTGPDLSAFDLYSGPNQSSSMQIINGAVSQSLTYYYVLSPKKEGKFTIKPAVLNVANGRVKSNEIPIEVVKGNPQQSTQNPSKNQSGNQGNQTTTTNTGDKLFIKAFLNKSSVYLGEQVTVTYKIFSKYGQINFSDLKLPTYNGFYTEDVPMTKNDKLEVENYNGSQYYTAELKRTLLFPQKSGKLEIPSLDATCNVREKVQSQNFFEQFMGGGYRDVQVKVKSQDQTLTVLPHPDAGKPADFKGAVGEFSIKAEVDKSKVRSGDPVNLKFTITGKGNIKLLEAPVLTFPNEFEAYDPQTKDNIRVSDGSMSGTRTFEYLLIPRAGGEYFIGPFSFSYFSPSKRSYQTVSVARIAIQVEKSAGDQTSTARSGNSSAPKQLATDIRFNKKRVSELEEINQSPFLFSGAFFLFSSIAPLSLILLLLLRRRDKERSSNSSFYRMKGAGSVAQKRMKRAGELLKENKKDAFYDEVFFALYGYLSDKLQIPSSELSRSTISQYMQQRNMPEADLTELIRLLDACEFARFAPGADSGMQQVYNDSIALLTRTENYLKS